MSVVVLQCAMYGVVRVWEGFHDVGQKSMGPRLGDFIFLLLFF